MVATLQTIFWNIFSWKKQHPCDAKLGIYRWKFGHSGYSNDSLLTHCGLVMPYGDIEMGEHWLRKWLVAIAWQQQAIIWTNVKSSHPYLRLAWFKITFLECHSILISPRSQWVNLCIFVFFRWVQTQEVVTMVTIRFVYCISCVIYRRFVFCIIGQVKKMILSVQD